ncbi:MAG: isochorismatase [Acidimicrobiia bacterium]
MTYDTEISLKATYRPRSIRPLEVWKHAGWTLKVYGIAEAGEYPRSEAITAAKRAAVQALPRSALTEHHYGIGFLGVHDAASGCYTFIDWWADDNELHHRLFVAPASKPDAFEAVSGGGSAACTWDLAVIGFERDAWVRHVLANPQGPDPAKYMTAWLTAEV